MQGREHSKFWGMLALVIPVKCFPCPSSEVAKQVATIACASAPAREMHSNNSGMGEEQEIPCGQPWLEAEQVFVLSACINKASQIDFPLFFN